MVGHWTVILNPKAQSGRGGRHWKRIAKFMREADIPFELYTTEYPRHAETLTLQALQRGDRKICAVGGDGTVNEVINAILNQTDVPSEEVKVAQIPIGTGNDWGRTLGIPSDYKAAVRLLKKEKPFLMDAGKVHYLNDAGQMADRWFINIAGMGYDAFVGITANKRKEQGKGGKLGYMIALVKCLFRYQIKEVSFETAEGTKKMELFSIAIANCKYNGGGMMQAPDAKPNDGILNVTFIGRLSKFEVIKQIKNLFSGAFVKHPAVTQFKGKTFTLTSEKRVLLEVDGENIGTSPATFTIREKCITAIVK